MKKVKCEKHGLSPVCGIKIEQPCFEALVCNVCVFENWISGLKKFSKDELIEEGYTLTQDLLEREG